ITMCYLSWKVRVKHPYVLFAWLWYLGTLIPVIGLLQVGEQAMADRYVYVPLIGLLIATVWSVSEFLNVYPSRNKLIPIVATLLIGIFFMITWKQTGYWKNSVTLFQHAIDVTTDNYLARNNLGNAMIHLGKNDEAYRHYTEALRIKPYYADAHYNMGILLTTRGKLDKAIDHYKAAIRSNPRLKKAYYNLGTLLSQKGSNAEAVRNLLYALQIDPEFAEAHNNLGVALIRQGKIHEAAAHFIKAVRLKTDYIDARKNLQKARKDMKQVD
ncbi:MAG: tetratricopeptide repeat protein, partial [Desulfobacterales bacterium]